MSQHPRHRSPRPHSWRSCMQPPHFLHVDPDGIPDELKSLRQWVAWKAAWNEEKERCKKVPINPHTGRNASPTNPKTWGTFDQAYQRMLDDNLQGVGFVFTASDPY